MYKLSTNEHVGQLLTSRRKALGLTQAQVASRLGISQNRLSELESHPASLSVDRLLALAGILGLELTLHDRAKNIPTQSEW